MAKVSLKKRSETLKVSLKKAGLGDRLMLRVASALDISGSMQSLYRSGVMSEFVGKLLPFGVLFDDNEEIDMWAFDHGFRELPPATADVYADYVGNCMGGISISGGTAYAPVMNDIYGSYFGKVSRNEVSHSQEVRPKGGFFGKLLGKTETVTVSTTQTIYEDPENMMPAMVLFQTDGENTDDSTVRSLLSRNINTPVFWFMVGVGNSSFRSLKGLAKDFPNVDFISVESLDLPDEQLYDELLKGKFKDWCDAHNVQSVAK